MSKSYGTRGMAAPLNHKIYKTLIDCFGLNESDKEDLRKRGLTPQHIANAEYATKPNNANAITARATGEIVSEYGGQLEGVPGLYQNEKTGHWTLHGVYGIFIPVRDMQGNINQIVIRNANPTKNKEGRYSNKYVAFSSAGKPKGGKVWQKTHCPVINGTCAVDNDSVEIRITEGVLKADVATALGEFYCLGLQGLKIHDDLDPILEKMEACTVRLSFDAGEDDNIDMLRIKCQLINYLHDRGIEAFVEKWDKKYGKGIDDVILNDNQDKIELMSDEEVEKLLKIGNAANPCNGNWIYVIEIERFINIKTKMELKKSQFADLFQLEDQRAASALIGNGVRCVHKLTYFPAQDEFIEEGEISYYNIWENPSILPEAGDVTPFTEHMKYVFDGNEEYLDIFLDWAAFQVQKPGIKILWAMVIIGEEEGTGKSFISEVMKNLLGYPNVSSPTNEEVHEIYTPWLKQCSLVVIEEMMSRGRLELMNKLKPIITQDQINIREMHKQSYMQKNRANLLMFSNHKDAILVNKKDRRYCIIESNAKPKEKAYYTELWDWLRLPDTVKHIMKFLLDRDISKFDPNARAPMTDSKREITSLTRTPLEEWIAQGVEDEYWPFKTDVICIRHLKDVAPRGLEKASDFKYAEALSAAGARRIDKQVRLSDGSRARLWSLRRHEIHNSLDPEELARRYEKIMSDEPSSNPLEEMKPM